MSIRQSLSTTTVLFATTFTRTFILNLLKCIQSYWSKKKICLSQTKGLDILTKFNVFAFCRSVDPSEALHMPGVRAYIGADDVPDSNRTGAVIYDEELFATEKVILLNKCLSYS